MMPSPQRAVLMIREILEAAGLAERMQAARAVKLVGHRGPAAVAALKTCSSIGLL